VRNAVMTAMVTHRLHSGVKPLNSGRKGYIMSMAGVGFFRTDVIENLRKVVLEHIVRLFGGSVSWDFSEEPVDTGHGGSTGKFLRWRTYFSLGKNKKDVVFQEDSKGYLSVSVGDIVVIKHFKMGRLGFGDLDRLYKELLK
jgi:hypothetical protein